MNKTRKLTQGAMYLAIVGAILLVDRQLSFAFTEIAVMAFSVVVVMYSAMYSLKDGVYLSLGLVTLIVLLGGVYTYIYGPISIVVGLVYSFFLTKDKDSRILRLSAMVSYTACEFIATYAITPLLGTSVTAQIQAVEESLALAGFSQYLEILGPLKGNLLMIGFIGAIIITGIMEGLIIHLLSILLLKRFKIKEIKTTNIIGMKVNPIIAYVSMFAVILSLVIKVSNNIVLSTIIASLTLVGSCILIYLGYLFIISYMNLVLRRRNTFFVVLLIIFTIPTSLLVLIILGFLYGSGPLYNKIQTKRFDRHEEE